MATLECFHCGLPVPAGTDYRVRIHDIEQPMCCPGCQAVAQVVVDSGLDDFYRHRDARPRSPATPIAELLPDLAVYDRPQLQRNFVTTADGDTRETSLILEGIVCAACIWLNEKHVNALPGVLEFRVNYATHRAHVRWDAQRVKLSDILRAVTEIGYIAHPYDIHAQQRLQQDERRRMLWRIGVAGLGAMQVMMIAVALYTATPGSMSAGLFAFLRWISLLISVPVIVYAAAPFFRGAWRDLRRYRPGMDVPVALAIGGGFLASGWHTWTGTGEVYFDSVTMFTFLLLGGRFLEMNARQRASAVSEEVARLLPAVATRVREGRAETIAVAELVAGDEVLIRPGETVPADGSVLTGTGSVDESLLTGESLPLAKTIGDQLIGGSLNHGSPLTMRVAHVGDDTVVAGIMRLLDRAQTRKPRIAMLADRIATWFVAALLVFAVLVGWWWWQHDPARAFEIVLAILVVTCPCALSLATPTALTAAMTALARLGVLITRGHALETLAQCTHFAFDKTGTLTHGTPRLERVVTLRNVSTEACHRVAAALEFGSEHPFAQALRADRTVVANATDVVATPGAGIEGRVDGIRYRLGTPAFVGTPAAIPPSPADGCSWVELADDSGPLAWFAFSDRLRADAGALVNDLRTAGIEMVLLSGDAPATAQRIAAQLGIEQAYGGLRPDDKLAHLLEMQKRGATVAMVGDGINDAPVLAGAPVSIAIAGGAQLAHAAADMVLMSPQLRHIATARRIARHTMSVVRQNFAWAVTYNLIALPLAAGGWLTPWMAAIGMSASSLLVVLNSLRLLRETPAARQSLHWRYRTA